MEEEERQAFLDTYLNEPSLEAFTRGEREQIQTCFVRLPREPKGCYAKFQMNMVETPDTGDITGILSVMDVTDQAISEQIYRRLSVTGHDYVADLDLRKDFYTLLTNNKHVSRIPAPKGATVSE